MDKEGIMKVPFFNGQILKCFGCVASWMLTIFSIVAIFWPITNKYKWCVFISLILLHIIAYLLIWNYFNIKKSITIRIRNTKIRIKEGDLFAETGKKIIAFNEYFDTRVDDIIIAKDSLNGIFITEHIEDVSALDQHISKVLSNRTPTFVDERSVGKKIKYDLGTIVPYDDFYLLAYSRFDENNSAYLQKDDLAKVYLKMWDEIDIIKACNSICMPILGSAGLVRKLNYTPQQLLEWILWTFRISGINMTRSASITIVVDKSVIEEIDFLKLKDYSD